MENDAALPTMTTSLRDQEPSHKAITKGGIHTVLHPLYLKPHVIIDTDLLLHQGTISPERLELLLHLRTCMVVNTFCTGTVGRSIRDAVADYCSKCHRVYENRRRIGAHKDGQFVCRCTDDTEPEHQSNEIRPTDSVDLRSTFIVTNKVTPATLANLEFKRNILPYDYVETDTQVTQLTESIHTRARIIWDVGTLYYTIPLPPSCTIETVLSATTPVL